MLAFSRGPSVSLMSGITEGGGLFKMSWKCSANLALCSGSVEMVLPSLFLSALVSLLLFPDTVLVISYNLFMFCCTAAVSATVARALKKFFLSFLALFQHRCLVASTSLLGLFFWPVRQID